MTPPPTSATRIAQRAVSRSFSRVSSGPRTRTFIASRIATARSTSWPVRRFHPTLEPDVVLETDAHVPAHDRGEGDVRELSPTDGERGEDAVGRELVHESEQRARVVRSSVGDAHAELQHRRLVDEPLLDELLREHEVPGVEDLDLRANAELADLARHLTQHRGRIRHDVVAFGEVHRPAVERADLGSQLGDVLEALGRTRHVGSLEVRRERRVDASQHEVAPHACGEVEHHVHVRRADPLDDLAIEGRVA
jgi:hypothetical protein